MTIAALAPFRDEPVRTPVDDDFSRLYRQYRPQLLRYVTHHFGGRDADEITQEALTRALRALDRERSEAETWAWLVRVARNVAHDLARSRRICDATEDGAMPADDVCDDAILPEPAALLDEKRRLVRRALKTLPPSQRRILVLYEVDELNCPAIARLVGSTEDAVRKALQRARRRFAAEVRAMAGGSLGSVAFWLRRSVRKAMPAASASTALVAFVGTVALTVSVNPAPPERYLDPGSTYAAAASHPELDHGAVGHADSRMAVRGASVRAGTPTAPKPPADKPSALIKLPVPDPLPPGSTTRIRYTLDAPVVGPVKVLDLKIERSEGTGVICSLDEVECTYE